MRRFGVLPPPSRARSGCSGSSGAWCAGASARCCDRSPAPCRRRRSWQPRSDNSSGADMAHGAHAPVAVDGGARSSGQPQQRNRPPAPATPTEPVGPRARSPARPGARFPAVSTSVVLTRLDGESVARWLTAGRDALDAARDEIDELNVYPVPDGDTGTNLHLTLVAAVEALTESSLRGGDTETPTPRRLMSTLAHGALLGPAATPASSSPSCCAASSDGLDGVERAVDAGQLARALPPGPEPAYAAVADPVEGTMLTVARAAAEAAEEVAAGWRRRRRRRRGAGRRGHRGRRGRAGRAGPHPRPARGAAPGRRRRRRRARHLRAARRARRGRHRRRRPRRPRCGGTARRRARRAPGPAAGWTSRTRTRTGRRTR